VRRDAGRQVVLALRRAGLRAGLRELPRAAVGQAIGEDGSSATFQAAIVDMPPLASYDPDFLRRIFGADPDSAPLNYAGYRSAAFTAAAERVASAPDPGARKRAVRAELRLLASDVPALPLFFSRGTFAFRPAIHDGWAFVRGAGILDKQSFLANEPRNRAAPREGLPQASDEDSGDVLGVLSTISLVVLAGILVLAGVALARRRAPEKR
jgi:hypothetical protein